MIALHDIEIVVTAGGKSTRMEQDKGLMLMNGKPMLLHLTDRLQQHQFPFRIIANSPAYDQLGFNSVKDVIAHKGPMGALHTGFHYTQKQFVLLLACDSPFFPIEAIHRLINNIASNTIIVTETNSSIHPLQAIYPVTLKNKVAACISENKLKLQDLILESTHRLVAMDDLTEKYPTGFMNMNTPNDIAIWKAQPQVVQLG
ncbi:MAG: molybdenum cofactor guanylyltransferase [Bacteroidetes bacterium]|nr:molybdenum cofactor guanylyltransferase [Bacteroidota bacterium]